MLAKILQDMWVDPEVLEALNEEQKRILFLKMREEQVRRWRVREEKEKREGWSNVRPKKVSNKSVTWLIGRDGDVSVSIIGEMDEFKSSKLLQNLNNRVHGDSINSIQTVDLLSERATRQIIFTDDMNLPVTDVNEDLASPNKQPSQDLDSCSTDLKDPSEDSDTDSGNGSDSGGDCNPVYRPRFCSHGDQRLKAQLSGSERAGLQDRETFCHEDTSERHGRVAQLRKAFADEPQQKSPYKPPVPAKPAHLQRTTRIH
ncbi:SH2 domain-containing protein 4A [Austrofundulus limnaeus]|uniref:SH2 domain-containing protein 4A-like n=1 Tax=Austrofundulus limnaeus TaxID=52670 RepID=A0A2I4CS24_AUSLI|nr:PREDICTED: SH2 domain-containing protein 4A-like [Austrofundulus limnaeus]XP_013882790.1 PREDICTED: SH2 domain-containing protein 4A-like [Austrofundulus limnaeus]